MAEERITQEELAEMFGERMPIEAVNLLFGGMAGLTTADVRKDLYAIAVKWNPAVEIKALIADIDQWLGNMGVIIVANRVARTARPMTGSQKSLMRVRDALVAALKLEKHRDAARQLVDAAEACPDAESAIAIGGEAIAILRSMFVQNGKGG